MNYCKKNLENIDKLIEVIELQRNLLDSQELSLKIIMDNIESSSKKGRIKEVNLKESNETLLKIGEFAEILRDKGVPYGRNKIHSWLNNRGYTYRENDRNYAKAKYINKGLFKVKSYVVNKKDGPTVEGTIHLTSKGVKYFTKEILKEFNIKEI